MGQDQRFWFEEEQRHRDAEELRKLRERVRGLEAAYTKFMGYTRKFDVHGMYVTRRQLDELSQAFYPDAPVPSPSGEPQ